MRAFVCNILPQKIIVEVGAPQASNNFCTCLIDGECFDKVCSIVPMSYFHDEIDNTTMISYYHGNKKRSRFMKIVSLFVSNFRCAWNLRKSKFVWFYNICETHFLLYLLMRYVLFKKVYVILLDHTPNENILSIRHYVPYLYKQCHGVISLSMRTNISNANMRFKAGVISSDKIKQSIKETRDRLTYLFSGSISSHAGFPLAFEVFSKMPNVELYISGHGDIGNYDFDAYANIHYLGYLDYEDYIKLYDKVDVCLSLRDPSFPENNNNFPSKILEYFMYNKIVISTIEYPELIGFNYIKTDFSKHGLCHVINQLELKPKDDLVIFKDNQKALYNNFSVESWKLAFEEVERGFRV